MGHVSATSEGANVEKLLAAFWFHQLRRDRSPNTRKKYEPILRHYLAWVGDRDLNDLTASDIEDYLNAWFEEYYERHQKLPAPKTQANRITAMRSFHEYLERFDKITRNVMRKIESPKVEPKENDWLQPDEDEAVLASCRSPQERIVIPLLRFTGIRSGEASALPERNVDRRPSPGFPNGKIVVQRGHTKSKRGREIPIVDELVPYLDAWELMRERFGVGGPHSPWLCTSNRKPMREKQIWGTVKRVATRAGVRRQTPTGTTKVNTSEVTPHTLRRTFATHLFNKGVRLEVISKALGHENTSTTERSYAALTNARIAAEILDAVN